MTTPKKKKYFSLSNLGFYFLIITLAVVAIFKFSELQKIIQAFEQIKPWFWLIALGLQTLTYLANAYVYYNLMLIFEIKPLLKPREILNCSVTALFINQAVPSAGASGNSFIFYYFNKRNIKMSDALTLIIFELSTYFLAHITLILFLFAYFTFSINDQLSGIFYTILFIGLAVFGVLTFIWLFLGQQKGKVLDRLRTLKKYRFFAWLIKKLKSSFTLTSGQAMPPSNAWEIITAKYQKLARPLLWQIILILLDSTTIYFLFLGLNVRISFIHVLLALMVTKIISLFSIIPGALVFFEGGMIFFLTLLGIPAGMAFVVTLLFRFLSFWLPMPIGLFLYRHMTKNLDNMQPGQLPPPSI